MSNSRRTLLLSMAALAFGPTAAIPALADPVADFYKGKQINLVIGTSAGNDYDYRARLLARYMGKHIPGNPQIVPRNMPGGGGVQAANWIANIAPRDGTTLHMIMANMMASQAMGMPGVEFDTRKFTWIGNTSSTPNVVNSWYTSGVETIEDVRKRELIVGAPMGTAGALYPLLMNALAGTKFKLVTGYPGGNEANLAMERGETEGRGSNSWAAWKSTKPEWVRDKKIHVLVQIGLKRDPDLPNVPLMLELARNDDDRKLLTFISSETEIARALVAPPEVPSERIEALRRAFDATVRDPEFLAEAEKMKMDISPSTGEEAQKIADAIANTPPEIASRARRLIEAPQHQQ
jgi:tripartite-type tricarboxylate transporter receptor subunit TctC